MRFPAAAGRFFKGVRGRLDASLEGHPVIFTVVLSFLVTVLTEVFSRHSLIKGLAFIFAHPLNFLTCMLIVLGTVSLAHLFKKRVFFLTLFAGIWLAAGIVNGVMLFFRVTPFGTIDFTLLPSVFSIITVYLEIWQIVLIAVLAVCVLAGLAVLFVRSAKRPVNYRLAGVVIATSVLLAVGSYALTVVGHEETREDVFGNIADAYKTYGFVYCFTTGTFDRGVSKPDFYSRAAVNWLTGNLKDGEEPEVLPNIIMVQLESFFDVSYLDDVEYGSNPTPHFSSLKRRYSNGFLTVPSVGAGTANTEFEVLSGMSLDFFGMGEYPYKTILKEQACESVVRDLKALGYTGTAIHNNTGTFYGRNEVFAQLGFDKFVPIECMGDIEYNPIGWAKDKCLTGEIIKALDATPNQDFIFTITVQGHGKYQKGVDSEETEDLNVTWETDPEDAGALAYYMEQLRETDSFIGDLTVALSHRAEPTVLVLYGDHLPNFNIGSEQLRNGDIFETEYVIWSNMRLPERDEDLTAYQLSARVLRDLGISEGLLTKYHQQMSETQDYLDGLQLLEYDMLYGDYYCYGGENPYTATDLQMGSEPVVITGWELDGEGILHVYGENFTDWSVIVFDGDNCETVRESDGELTTRIDGFDDPGEYLDGGKVLTVCQETGESVVLSECVGVVVDFYSDFADTYSHVTAGGPLS